MTAIIQPSDTDDPVAMQWAGETVTVLRRRDDTMTSLVYVQLTDPIDGKAFRLVLRAKDVKEEA